MTEFSGLTEGEVLAKIEDGQTITAIARELGRSKSTLSEWLGGDPERSARAREARVRAADAWDDLAEEGIRLAGDPFELAKAKEIAHHYRWRAAKIAPKVYGDKVESTLQLGDSITKIVREIIES